MKLTKTILWLSIAIIVSLLCLYILRDQREGFFDIRSDYTSLKTRVSTMMSPYCDLATYAQAQMREIYTAIGESNSEVEIHIQKTYADVYACKDEDASSRPSCSSGKSDSTPGFISCDTYMKLPDWSENQSQAIAIALSAIPDNLADRITREVDWYSQMTTKLRKGLDAGNSPPAKVPDSDHSPASNSSGKPWSVQGYLDYMAPMDTSWRIEGFDNTCSPEASQAKIQAATQADQTQASCTLPTPDTQITRVNAILNSNDLQAALAKCASLKAIMENLKSDQQKLKSGTLYAWQNSGPTKTFVKLPAGNRTDGLLSSLRQNQS